jgi:hypothetical protein
MSSVTPEAVARMSERRGFLATAQQLVDDHDKEPVLAAVNELALLTAHVAVCLLSQLRISNPRCR